MRKVWQQLRITMVFVTHDIDEAVYLGQRVVMLSASPTHVVDEMTVDLPDRRDQLTTRSDPSFSQLRARVYSRIRATKQVLS